MSNVEQIVPIEVLACRDFMQVYRWIDGKVYRKYLPFATGAFGSSTGCVPAVK